MVPPTVETVRTHGRLGWLAGRGAGGDVGAGGRGADALGDLLGDALMGRLGVGERAVQDVHGVALDEHGDDVGMLGEQAGAVGLQVGQAGGGALGGEGGELVVDLGMAGLQLGDSLAAVGELGLGLGAVGAKLLKLPGEGGSEGGRGSSSPLPPAMGRSGQRTV